MKDHPSPPSSSSPQPSKESIPKSLQSLKITPEEKTGTMLGSAMAAAVVLSLRQPYINVLGYEPYKVCISKKPKTQKAEQTEPKIRKPTFSYCVFHLA